MSGTSGRTREPPPARVRGNDWRGVAPRAPGGSGAAGISVVVPYREAPDALALTLAGLERQTWPARKIEAIVVDDGSRPPLAAPPPTALDVRVLRQEDRGFGLARARNAGAAAASHDILVFLDCDVVPVPGLLAAHARWHEAVGDALSIGFTAHASAAGIDLETVRRDGVPAAFADRPMDPPWIERHMARTAGLTAPLDDLFRAVTGGNLGIRRRFFDEVGGFDEAFVRYGGEDTEFGYRAQVRGGLLVPARDAFGYHLGRWREDGGARAGAAEAQAGVLANRIPLPGFRGETAGRTFPVPRHVVSVAADAPAERVLEAVHTLLADPPGDLAVCVETDAASAPAGSAPHPDWLSDHLASDPRVRIPPPPSRSAGSTDPRAPMQPDGTALDAFPASPFHVSMPAGAVRPGLLGELLDALGDRAAVAGLCEDGARAVAARAWALHRVRRAGGAVGDYGATATVRMARAGPARRRGRDQRRPEAAKGASPARSVRRARGLPAGFLGSLRQVLLRPPGAGTPGPLARAVQEARDVRGPRTAFRFARWLVSGLRWRLGQGTRRDAPAASGTPLGVEIAALGPASRTAFAASSRVAGRVDGRRLDVVLADTEAVAAEALARGLPAAVLGSAPGPLAVPAFDPRLYNPIGWVRDVERCAAALGPPKLLGRRGRGLRAGSPGAPEALRLMHHVEDTAAFHANPAARAGALVRLAACGLPVRLADGGAPLAGLLGEELHGLMLAERPPAGAAGREALSIRQRRAALRDHSLAARVRQVCAAAGFDGAPAPPLVSVLLATRRPGRLDHALEAVARQRYRPLELVLALHGDGWDGDAAASRADRLGIPFRVLRRPADVPLGAILNAASAAARGTLLAKMDDDDVYGPDHLLDLALAHEYSGADLAGKFAATVYLARRDVTVRRRWTPSERFSAAVSGGALLVSRAGLDRAGGWRRLPHGVDSALVADVVASGGRVYRTHDEGYVLVRHGADHAWRVDDRRFLVQAEEARDGWRPELAGIEDAELPWQGARREDGLLW